MSPISMLARRMQLMLPILILMTALPASASILLLDGLGFLYSHANGTSQFVLNPPASGASFANSGTAIPAIAFSVYETNTSGFDFLFTADAGAIADPADAFGDPSYANVILSLWFTIHVVSDTRLDFRLTASDVSCSEGGSSYFSFTSGLNTIDWADCEQGQQTGQFLVTPGGQALSIFYNLAALDTGANGSLALARYQLQLSLSAAQPPVSGSIQDPPVHMPEPETLLLVSAAGLLAAGSRLASRCIGRR